MTILVYKPSTMHVCYSMYTYMYMYMYIHTYMYIYVHVQRTCTQVNVLYM